MAFNDYTNLFGFQGSPIVFKTRSKKEAESLLARLQNEYMVRGLSIRGSEVKQSDEDGIAKYTWIYSEILEEELTDFQTFPFSIYQSYHFKNQIWTMSDVLKSMQLFIDRYIGQLDYSLGKDIKNLYEIVTTQLADGLTPDEAIRKANIDGFLQVKAPNAVNPVRPQGVNPQWMQMVQVMQSYIEDLSGGRSFQGLSEGARESGAALKEKRLSGEALAGLYLDNLSRYKKDLGNKAIERLRQDTAERIIRVGGGELSDAAIQQLTAMNHISPSNEENTHYVWMSPATHLKDADIELSVSESEYSETAKDKKFTKLSGAAQLMPEIRTTPTFQIEYLKSIGLSFDITKGIQNDLQQAEQARQQQQQQVTEAEAQRSQSEAQKNQVDSQAKQVSAQVDAAGVAIDRYKAETDRMNVLADAAVNQQNAGV